MKDDRISQKFTPANQDRLIKEFVNFICQATGGRLLQPWVSSDRPAEISPSSDARDWVSFAIGAVFCKLLRDLTERA